MNISHSVGKKYVKFKFADDIVLIIKDEIVSSIFQSNGQNTKINNYYELLVGVYSAFSFCLIRFWFDAHKNTSENMVWTMKQ